MFVIDLHVKNIFNMQNTCTVHARVWLAARLVASLQHIAYCHGLKRTCRKTGTY